jgi:hypothetical protein
VVDDQTAPDLCGRVNFDAGENASGVGPHAGQGF